MHFIHEAISWLSQNYDLVALAIVAIISILRLTKWGKANAEALDAIVAIVEKTDATEVKEQVAQAGISANAKDVLEDKVAKHDDDKPNPNKTAILAREIAKTVGYRLAKRR